MDFANRLLKPETPRHSQSFFARRAAKMVGDTAGATLVMRRVLFVYVFLVHRFARAWG
jgi:hypothetical protein